MSVRPRVLLFDIDGTLITTAGAGRAALDRAVAAATGRAGLLRDENLAGATDRGAIRRGLRRGGLPEDDDAIDAVLAVYLPCLDASLAEVTTRVHPGVTALLDTLSDQDAVAIGLGTGNIAEGARRKLQPVGLWDRFAFGGFGDDGELRADLIRAGAIRGAAVLGVPMEAARVVVIGDSVHDVDAALAIGARCVAVGTSGTDLVDLAARGAHLVVETLADPEVAAFLAEG
jgi:phosphoglycolate phosphatase-like HAD superfamily hydrolase